MAENIGQDAFKQQIFPSEMPYGVNAWQTNGRAVKPVQFSRKKLYLELGSPPNESAQKLGDQMSQSLTSHTPSYWQDRCLK